MGFAIIIKSAFAYQSLNGCLYQFQNISNKNKIEICQAMKVYSRKSSFDQSKVSKDQSQFKTPIKQIKNQIEADISTHIRRTNSQTQQKSTANRTTSHKLDNSVRQIYTDRFERSPLTKFCFTKLRKIRSIKQIQQYIQRQSVERYHFKSPSKAKITQKAIQFPQNKNGSINQQFVKNGPNTKYMSANAIMKRKINKNKKDKIAINIFALQDSIQQFTRPQSQSSQIVCI